MRTFQVLSKYNKGMGLSFFKLIPKSDSRKFSTWLLSSDGHLRILKNQLSQAKRGSSHDISKALSNLTNYYNYLFVHQKKLSVLIEWIPTLKEIVYFSERSGSTDISTLENLQKLQDLLNEKQYEKDCELQPEELDDLLKPYSSLNTKSEKKSKPSKPIHLKSIQSQLNSVFQYLNNTVAGMDSSIEKLLRQILAPRLSEEKVVKNARIKCEKGFILYGPPGTGKTYFATQLVKALKEKTDINISSTIVRGPELSSKWHGETEQNIRKLFESDSDLHVIILDELDSIAKSRDQENTSPFYQNQVNQLLSMMDGPIAQDNVLVIGTTNRLSSLDQALLRPGRFGFQIKIANPSRAARERLLEIYFNPLKDKGYLHNEVDFNYLAKHTKGFSGAQLCEVINLAKNIALARYNQHMEDALFQVTWADITQAMHEMGYSLNFDPERGEIFLDPGILVKELSKVVGGLSTSTLDTLRRVIEPHFTPRDIRKAAEIRSEKGILFYGPPGTGKTFVVVKLAKILRQQTSTTIKGPFIVNASELASSLKNIRNLFNQAKDDPEALYLYLIDEFDTIAASRGFSKYADDVINEFLTMLEGPKSPSNILFFATTNRKEQIDPAILRNGRIAVHIKFDLPNMTGRLEILRILINPLQTHNFVIGNIDLDYLAKNTEGFSGADLRKLVNEAKLLGLQRFNTNRAIKNFTPFTVIHDDFLQSLKSIKINLALESNTKNVETEEKKEIDGEIRETTFRV